MLRSQLPRASELRRLHLEVAAWKLRCEEQQKLLADAELVIAELRKLLAKTDTDAYVEFAIERMRQKMADAGLGT